MLNILLIIIALTLIPTLELRASIPYGIYALQNLGYSWIYAPIIAFITNIILGVLVYLLLDKFVIFLTKFKFFKKIYDKKIKQIHDNIFPKTELYGDVALAAFIAIPLPGSGSYTGALAALILGIKLKPFFWINLVGVFIATVIVTILSLSSFSILGI